MLVARALGMHLALTLAAVTGALAFASCSDDAESTKRVLGTEGRERWVVKLEGKEPDLAEYRGLLKDDAVEAEAYAERMRRKLETDHEEFKAALDALNGRIVERWWMSGAVTVEIEAGKAPSLEKAPGVASLTPDVPLEP